MRSLRVLSVAVVLASGSVLFAVAGDDAEAVKAVVQSAYVEGVHADPDAAAMRKGFHPDFRMLVLKGGTMQAVTLDEWASRIEKRKAEDATKPRPQVRGEFTGVDVTGDAATVKVQLHRDGKQIFTDYLLLYRFPDGWKIVSKTFQAHP